MRPLDWRSQKGERAGEAAQSTGLLKPILAKGTSRGGGLGALRFWRRRNWNSGAGGCVRTC